MLGEPPLASAFVEAKNTPFDGHSRKPAFFAEIIERQFPGVARLEMFCRSPRPGWTSHGDQVVAPKRKALEHSAEPGAIEVLLARIED